MDFDPKILNRFFDGTYSRKDYLDVKSIFGSLEHRKNLNRYLLEHWTQFSSTELPEENVEHLLEKIHYRISLEEKRKGNSGFLFVLQKIAAIFFVPLLLSFLLLFYFQDEKIEQLNFGGDAYAEIQCPLGVRTKFQLPDGTTGFLNSGSKLQYPVPFMDDRDVTVSGEAFFNVVSDKTNPFIVHTPNLNVRVLGTQFNVMAYEDDSKEEVILTRGEVVVDTKNGMQLDVLHPDEKLVLNKRTMSFKTIKVIASQYIGWTEGKLVFRNENMQQVAERLGRWYNADIRVEDEELLEYTFHATFVDEPLEEVLKIMAVTTPYKYEILPRVTDHENICQKKVVLVKLDRKRLKAFH
ncbi:FecR family protein [Mariniphaga anaerophila]|uniref:FecR family protein n=1 Tax=Mariniphaga anaerophila TaxID=1484053 RepID=A0A1M4ZT83_9BACT|nr:FecR domain-containing protein [Mariniphaga anaerophila]SHF20786.1 FecR family protein [Mariniphaga anaerophila]